MAKSTAQRRALRRRLFNAQGGRCYYCEHRMGPPNSGQLREATLDEIIPLSAGGPEDRANCVAACRVCNEAKANMPATDFLAVLAEFKREAANG